MSLQFILDGYNIINQIPSLAPKTLEEQRREFIGLIEIRRPQGSQRNSVTVVFDGKSGVWSASRSQRPNVIFSRDESADEKIKKLVGQAANKKQCVVVTDDRDLKMAVRSLGASVVSVDEFLGKMSGARPPGGRTTAGIRKTRETPKVISKTLEYAITKELEEIWLKRENKRPREC